MIGHVLIYLLGVCGFLLCVLGTVACLADLIRNR